jgi:transcriptional regulator with XRE-family HTH domain
MRDLTKIRVDTARLKTAREQAGLTQEAAAARVGVKKPAISKYENGRPPKADVFVRLLLLYELDVHALIKKAA